jgi:hypothetical protein
LAAIPVQVAEYHIAEAAKKRHLLPSARVEPLWFAEMGEQAGIVDSMGCVFSEVLAWRAVSSRGVK